MKNFKLHILISFKACTLVAAFFCNHEAQGLPAISEHSMTSNMFYCEIGKNFPVNKTAQNFGASLNFSRNCGFRHPLNDKWIMGISLGFKTLRRKGSNGQLDILMLTHEAHRVFRIQHPLYLSIAAKAQYLAPTASQRIPTERDPDYETEVGAGLSATFWYKASSKWIINFRWDRWRGTKTTQLQGYETAFGASYLVP